MKKKRNVLIPALMILTAVLFVAVIPTEAESAVYEDTVRLHILANSDSEEDQQLKLKIRDAVLDKYGENLSEFDSKCEAEKELSELLSEIESFTVSKIREFGYDYNATAELTTEWYETREYGDFALPRGYYTSLKILIGEGAGKNWWCVMFPPLCLEAALEDAPADDAIKKYSDEEYKLISQSGYNVKFKLLEIFSEVFKR